MGSALGKRVLVVDDDAHVRAIVCTLIERAGCHAVAAAGGAEGLAQLTGAEPVDLIILDIDMPGLNGFEVLRRARDAGVTAPVVMLTGRSKDEHVLEGYQGGADYYIPKPFHAQTVLNIVEFLIGDLSEEQRAELEKKL
jgi:DNA-binding response OmpR family regulator